MLPISYVSVIYIRYAYQFAVDCITSHMVTTFCVTILLSPQPTTITEEHLLSYTVKVFASLFTELQPAQ
jgi:hypothetical protein